MVLDEEKVCTSSKIWYTIWKALTMNLLANGGLLFVRSMLERHLYFETGMIRLTLYLETSLRLYRRWIGASLDVSLRYPPVVLVILSSIIMP